MSSDLNQEDLVKRIMEEARRRYAENPACPGGLRTKIYGVWMEIGLKVGERMKAQSLKRGARSPAKGRRDLRQGAGSGE